MRHLVSRLHLLSRRKGVRVLSLAATATGVCAFLTNVERNTGRVSPLSFSTNSLVSEGASEGSGDIGDRGKCCSGCIGRNSIAMAAARVGPAVVNISVSQGRSMGSGTIIDSDGTILTCAHVVVDFQNLKIASKGKVEVTLQDGRTFEGNVINADMHSDIAVVKIKSKTSLPTAKLGSSFKLRPGDWVLSMGCPLSLQNSVTAGIVSCVDRKSSDLGLGGMRREYLQTDCAVNVGNSGGPLVNLDGEGVGVSIMKLVAAEGLSFAVPIDSASKIIQHFKKNGTWKLTTTHWPQSVALLSTTSAPLPAIRTGTPKHPRDLLDKQRRYDENWINDEDNDQVAPPDGTDAPFTKG
ncbi:hypothetical protein GIB67_006873 [Kingdonia uniflora]|uniref:Protease Do-like 14 n=1 Tax=Kingdonia uniflora TaxID=39325 RepID=A0A7J7L034_9MAGN|nr:hypothetical protein GIB67_006873 [Kingdonia uniflora]